MNRIKSLLNRDILFLLASSFLFFGTYNLLLPTFPLYVKKLGGNETLVGLLGGLFALTAVFLRPYLSKMTDRRGRKVVLLIAGFTGMTGPLLYLFNFGFWFLALARIYHAISLAAYITASQTLLADLSQPENRGIIIGIYGIAGGTAMAIAPALGLKIAAELGYGPLFIISALVSLGVIPCIMLLREPQISNTDEQIKTVPLSKIIRNKWVLVPSIALFSVTMAQGATNAFLPLYGLSIGMLNFGIFFTVFSVTSMIGRVTAGILSDRLGRKTLALPALIMVGVGVLCLIRMPSLMMLVLAAILIGFGFSTTHTVLLALIIDQTTLRERSQAISFYANAFDLGVAAGAMGLGAIAGYSYSLLWLVVAMVALIGFILTAKMLPVEGKLNIATNKKI
ncbi:MAG: MFS transporter [Halanaerobiales bacterium]|nr:MFS transporter [Halanaerobiales bacterium]